MSGEFVYRVNQRYLEIGDVCIKLNADPSRPMRKVGENWYRRVHPYKDALDPTWNEGWWFGDVLTDHEVAVTGNWVIDGVHYPNHTLVKSEKISEVQR